MLKKLQVTRPQMRTLLVVCFLVVSMLGCANSDNPDTESTDTDILGPLRPGRHTFTFEDGQLFYVYVSPDASRQPAAARILASIHSVSGVTDDAAGREVVQFYLTLWEDMANQHGWVVVAPQFDQVRFNSFYQRLNPLGPRADIRLNDICDRLGALLPGLPTEKILLFGFSGGANLPIAM